MITGTHSIVRSTFPSWTAGFEGRIPLMYLDAKGIVTAAAGVALLTANDALALPWGASATDVVAAWQAVHARQDLRGIGGGQAVWQRVTALRLPVACIDGLTLRRFDANDPRMPAYFPTWAQFPADAQLSAHSMAYAMGPVKFAKFPKFLAAMEALDFLAAADESHMSEDGNAPLHPRNIADRELLLHAARAMAEGTPLGAFYGT